MYAGGNKKISALHIPSPPLISRKIGVMLFAKVILLSLLVYHKVTVNLQNHANLGPGQYEIKSCIDELKSEHKTRHGRFGKLQQYPDRPSDRIYAFSLSQNPRRSVCTWCLDAHLY